MLDRAVSAFGTAARLAAPDDPDLPQYLNNLGNALTDRFALTRDPDELAQAVAAAGRAVDLIPSRSPDRMLYLNNLANALLQRYEQSGAITDLDTAITTLRTAAQRAARHPPPAEPDDLGMVLANLGSALRLRYRQRLRPRDLRAALSACQWAVKATRTGSPELAPRLAGLADVMREQYLADRHLDRAITTYEQVLRHDAANPAGLMGYWNNLSNCLRDRYVATRNRQDLDRAVELSSRAVTQAGAGNAETAAMYLAGLGSRLRLRTSTKPSTPTGGQPGQCRRTLASFPRSVAILAPRSPTATRSAGRSPTSTRRLRISRPVPPASAAAPRYVRLTWTTSRQHFGSGTRPPVTCAASTRPSAYTGTSRASADRAPRLSNYAASLMAYATAGGSWRHAARAIRALRRAVGTTRPQDVNWPRYVGNLANALRQRHEWMHSGGDLQEAIRLYRQTCERGMETSAAVAFYAARDWAAWAASRRAWPEAASAYESGAQAMERLLGVQIVPPRPGDLAARDAGPACPGRLRLRPRR
jgi:hypothetical protein